MMRGMLLSFCVPWSDLAHPTSGYMSMPMSMSISITVMLSYSLMLCGQGQLMAST